jgi:hypothetical protein
MFSPIQRAKFHLTVDKNRHSHRLTWRIFLYFVLFTFAQERATKNAEAIVRVVITSAIEA